jgi:hypothetical protein
MRDAHWNESKEAWCGGSNYRFGSAGEVSRRLVASTAAVTPPPSPPESPFDEELSLAEREERTLQMFTVAGAGAAEAVRRRLRPRFDAVRGGPVSLSLPIRR